MNTKTKLLFLLLSILSGAHTVQGQNHALDFDGIDDFVEDANVNIINRDDFTVDAYFYYDGPNPATSCGTNDHTVYSLSNQSTGQYIWVKICAAGLLLEYSNGISNFQRVIIEPYSASLFQRWHRVAVVFEAATDKLKPYYDCQGRSSITADPMDLPQFLVGAFHAPGSVPKHHFKGQIDDVRVYRKLDVQGLCAARNCPLDLQKDDWDDIIAYWPFDQGTAGGNNRSITQVDFVGLVGQPGTVNNFNLNGPTSNFVSSGTGMLYPALTNLELRISDAGTQTTRVSEICSGDPVHFALYNNNQPIQPNLSYSAIWEMWDGTAWQQLPPATFSGFAFIVSPGALTIDCNASTTGFLNSRIRARFMAGQCEYWSDPASLRICCDPDQATVAVTPSATLCEDDAASFSVSITSPYAWINNPPSNVSIAWKYNGTPLSQFANQTSFTHAVAAVVHPAAGYEATVTLQPCGKTGRFSASVPVDKKPICGTIIGLPTTATLTLVSSSPLVYEMCPGNDAALGFDLPFQDCNPRWQYSFVPNSTNPADWTDMGASNSIQNTNILPGNYWQAGATEVYYRVQCDPLSTPSGCDPCFSNTLTIRLKQAPTAGSLSAQTFACIGDVVPITLTGASGGSIRWLFNGALVQNGGTTYNATEQGCYRVELDNGCEVVSTSKICIEFCGPVAVISCPLAPNDCARLPDPINLTGCGSDEGCGGGPLTYTWAWDSGTLVSQNGCDLRHIPDMGGTVYTLTVTDASGCTDVTSRRVVPCPQ